MRRSASSIGGRQAARAFSLIELLVVIAVIGILGALLLGALSRAQSGARTAKCQNNLSQIYKAARIYGNAHEQMLPDLYVGLPTLEHLKRYVNNNAARSEVTTGSGETAVTTQIPCGLWLLYTGKYAESTEVYFCPDMPGQRRFGGSENPTVDGLPERVGYMYNCFPDRLMGEEAVPLPGDLQLEEVSNDASQRRHMSFYALLADPFLTSRQVTHWARKGMSCCYWDGSVQWVDMRARGIPWNTQWPDPDGSAKPVSGFTEDRDGAIAMRDAWSVLSQARR